MASPVLDHQYWFERSKNVVDDSLNRIDDAASAIQKFALWLWAVYTGASAVGFALAEKRLSLSATLMASAASGLIIIVYWCSTWCKAPILSQFDPRSPRQIREFYSLAIREKSKRLRISLEWALIAAIAVTLSIVLASSPPPTALPAPQLEIELVQINSSSELLITARIEDVKRIEVEVLNLSREKVLDKVHSASYLTDSEGRIFLNVPIDKGARSLAASIRWNRGGYSHELTKTVDRNAIVQASPSEQQ